MSEKPVLLIDDDRELCALLTDYLGREGFAVESVNDGRAGLSRALSGEHCLVLLDLMLPEMDGIEVMRELHRAGSVPVIMLTAKGEEVDRIVGLELGADDYLPKPFNPRELVARIKAVLRRAGEGAPPRGSGPRDRAESEMLVQGDLTLDLGGYRALIAEEEIPLTVIEFCLLRELARSAGQVLSRDALLDRVRGREFELFDRSVDVHISHLRQKLGDDPYNPRYIKTVRSVGYMFIGGEG